MAAITAALVKDLREKTGAGMMDCKKALTENDGDVDAAIDWLRAKGLSKAAKKEGRVAADGLVGVAVEGTVGAVVEVNAETDFVARNETFQEAVAGIAKAAIAVNGDVEALAASAAVDGGEGSIADQLKRMVAKIGENMSLRRSASVTVDKGAVASYIHSATADGLGKIGVVVGLESEGNTDVLLEVGRKVAMHIAATNPLAAVKEELDPVAVERERQVLTEQARESGKPEAVIEKMIEGRIRKFYQEVVLVEQTFVMDPDLTVGQFIENAGKEAGAPVALKGFAMLRLGEGIEKKEEDFAAEVAAATGQ
ncbi:translation elongation factor Ts [Hirschia baltica]|uniref:Elongation factor Ts n=1 Tax=Hirschia baltica (strain ATCC 49814 / DSM 5838 / IFAM 1418) TaxID=582402 RepID=C6XJV9_HIRBI|nr:translation elongation factor Ts [Hirschia baltica]ACT59404.1 translation elongation factor Ts [Hirschia baltica ATCC 49814]